MILQALNQLAEAEGLVSDPDFEIKPVAWRIVLKADGTLVQIASQRTNLNEGTNKKPKYVGKPEIVPRMPIRTSGDLAFFLVDKSEYVLGFDPAGKQKPEKLKNRVKLFREKVDACLEKAAEPALKGVGMFLDRLDQFQDAITAMFQNHQWAPNDLFAFQVGLTSEPVHLLPSVREYWKQLRAVGQPQAKTSSPLCLVTGEPVAEVGLFPLLKKVPGGTSSGVSLISFNARAFESFGLTGNENAVISRGAAEKTSTALNRLLDPAYPDPNDLQHALGRRNIKLGDTAVCFWSATTAEAVTSALDMLSDLLEGEKTDAVSNVYQAVWSGKPVPVDDPSAFYVLILSGAQGRAIVRDWIESTLGQTLEHLALHFADLKMARTARPKAGNPETPVIPLRWLLDSLAAPGNSDTPAPLEAGFLRAAFTGSPYPFQILQRALVRARVETGRDEWIDAARNDARAALIRAVLNRRRRPQDSTARSRYPEIPHMLNPAFESDGYSLGALLAVLERLQEAALGGVNASVVDRFFSAASASPRSVFVRLLRNSRHHARKAGDDPQNGGLARWLDRMVDFFCSRFNVGRQRQYPASSAGIPAHLDLEQQGLFVIGYHHMRHWLWLKKEERRAWEADHPEVPALFRVAKLEEDESAAGTPSAE